MNLDKYFWVVPCMLINIFTYSQTHPEIYITNGQKKSFFERMQHSIRVQEFIDHLKTQVAPAVDRHVSDPEWMVSRLQMYWNTRYERVYVNGMDYSHGEGQAPQPTVRFSGSRDWATDYLRPALEDVKPYSDDPRGLYLQNGTKEGQPWEWVHPAETGHIIERINREILDLAEHAAFLYWITREKKYAVFASDILMTYVKGMYYRDPPRTVGDHKNALLMGLQTFEVIHEGVIEPVTVCYDFIHDYLVEMGEDLEMIQEVLRKWADQEIKYGVPDNNWNLMQARFITYLALALEDDATYPDGKGQQYYIDQVLNQNTEKQKALKDVVKNFDPNTAIWPEVAHYSIMVSDDLLEIFCLMDKTLNNQLLAKFPMVEKAILANFNYLFPHGFTVAYGDAKHARLRFNSLELLVAQYRKYHENEKEMMITRQLKRFIEDGAYARNQLKSLFQLFFYEDHLHEVQPASSFSEMVMQMFYSPNVSWIVQRNGHSLENGMMVSKNASLGNHSHTNGINIELYAKGRVIAPDAAAGVSYWSDDHIEYYSRFPAHNTVVVNGISDYRNMRGKQAFEVQAIYPSSGDDAWAGDYTFSDVNFLEPSTNSTQRRLTGIVRTSETSGFFVDIFRSAMNDGHDAKHEYIFHGQGKPIVLFDHSENIIGMQGTDQLSSVHGDLIGYDYFTEKKIVGFSEDFRAMFSLPSIVSGEDLTVNLWMQGFPQRTIFSVMAPYSRAIHRESVPPALHKKAIPALIVRQQGEARFRPFVTIIDAFNDSDKNRVENVTYFSPSNGHDDFIGILVHSAPDRKDYIYNSTDIESSFKFLHGEFSGTYAIASFKNETIIAMFLGYGARLERGLWKIENLNIPGAVLITVNESGLLVDAEQPFRLTMPISDTTDNVLSYRIINHGKEQELRTPVFSQRMEKYVNILLPAMKNGQIIFD